MQSKVKLSKRQIKEDKFTTFVLTSRERLSENWQFLVIGAVVVVLAIVGVAYFINSRASWKEEGSRQFAEAMSQFRSGNRQVAVTGFQQIVDDYGSHPLASKATYMLGQANFELRNYPEAIRFWGEYLDNYKDDQLERSAALAGIASAYEEQGDNAQAAGKYIEAVDAFPEGPMVGHYRAGAMRSYLAQGQVDKAREQLTLIEEKFADTDLWIRAARLFGEKAYAGQAQP